MASICQLRGVTANPRFNNKEIVLDVDGFEVLRNRFFSAKSLLFKSIIEVLRFWRLTIGRSYVLKTYGATGLSSHSKSPKTYCRPSKKYCNNSGFSKLCALWEGDE